MGNPNLITVFEHERLYVGDHAAFDDKALRALEKFYGNGEDFPFYKLISKGVCFKSYVGVIQVGKLQIEVLPKADKNSKNDEKKWRNVLIGMLLAVGDLDALAPSSSALSLHANSILELYFALYLKELDYLLHRGLVKKYRKVEGNVTALKGSLVFGKHIQQNVTHQERFYTRHTVYDPEHKLHQILYKALLAVGQLNHNLKLKGPIGDLMLHFPEMPDLQVNADTFTNLTLDRKTQSYKTALTIAKLILLNYHPDLRNGKNDVLALMFDMNALWERFVFVSLRKNLGDQWTVREQVYQKFWRSNEIGDVGMKPDIVLENGDHRLVLDTKWKNIGDGKPSPEDLRQLYAYHVYFDAQKVALVYPGTKEKTTHGLYVKPPRHDGIDKECGVILLAVPESADRRTLIKEWQHGILASILAWIGS